MSVCLVWCRPGVFRRHREKFGVCGNGVPGAVRRLGYGKIGTRPRRKGFQTGRRPGCAETDGNAVCRRKFRHYTGEPGTWQVSDGMVCRRCRLKAAGGASVVGFRGGHPAAVCVKSRVEGEFARFRAGASRRHCGCGEDVFCPASRRPARLARCPCAEMCAAVGQQFEPVCRLKRVGRISDGICPFGCVFIFRRCVSD